MLPGEIYAKPASTSKFKYAHPLNHMPVDDGSLRARLAYDLMTFMRHPDCGYYKHSSAMDSYDPNNSDDDLDLLIIDGYYKEAEHLIAERLKEDPHCEKTLFQQAFMMHLKQEYQRILEKEEETLKQNPRSVASLINKGVALLHLDKAADALKITDKALELDPENLTILSNKAYIEKILGRDAERSETLVRAYNISSEHRMNELRRQESKLLRDFDAVFMKFDAPKAQIEFNYHSGYNRSKAVH